VPDFFVAVGQFLCLVGLILGLLLAIAKWRRPLPSPSRENIAAESSETATRPLVKLAVVAQTRHATITVVPIENRRCANGQKPLASAKAVDNQRKPSRRKLISDAAGPGLTGERAVLLMKHARKRPRSDGPRVS
jgi:hypothetical protein